jgi:uncharacterized protein (DUF433 family)
MLRRTASMNGKEIVMALLDTLVAQPPPLRLDTHGVVRVGKTRVRLESVLHAYKSGCSAEDIRRKFPSLELADIYAVITYYLWYREEVEQYLEERQRIEEQALRKIQERFPTTGVRERLLARRHAKS